MSAVIAPRVIRVPPQGLDQSPRIYVQKQHNFISNINEKRAGTREAPTFHQQPRVAAAIKQPSLNQHIRHGPANTHISYDESIQERRIREAKEAGERILRASRLLRQVTAIGPTGGYSPLARKLLAASQTKKQPAVPFQMPMPMARPRSGPTSAPRDIFQACGWIRDSGNGAGLPPVRPGRDHVARKPDIPNLSKSPEIAAFTGKRPMSFVGASMPTSNTMPAAPVQRKRKRYIEDYPIQEMPPPAKRR
ncbi:hypothetical protein F4679DRAFT_592012 [Xylaria curta]|nr:hypothetical protein F4679DRAFT_592012 [Xylaria curta]